MKKLILLFVFTVFTVLSFAQTGELFEREVGTKRGKYPLTVIGLKNAIASLDSGAVYIAYPGIWDTTGLGTIPSAVKLNGWLIGQMVRDFNNEQGFFFDRGNGTWIFSDDYSIVGFKQPLLNIAKTKQDFGAAINALIDHQELTNASSINVFYGVADVGQDITSVALSTDVQGITGEAQMGFDQVNQPNLSVYGVTGLVTQKGEFGFGKSAGLRAKLRYTHFIGDASGDITNSYGFISDGIDYLDGATGRTTNYYGFYSDDNGLSSVVTLVYHFYGVGDFPSFFGGTVIQKIYIDNVSNPPTDAELDSAYPTAENGETFYIDDADGHTNFYQVVKITNGWMIFTGTAAL